MPKWWVVTPVFETTAYGLEPPEIARDVVLVEADTKREAKVKGVRALRALSGRSYMNWWKDTSESPFKGLLVEPAGE